MSVSRADDEGPGRPARDRGTDAPDRAMLARLGFARGADVYERARPDYPADAVDHLAAQAGIGPGTRVLDLGAGTGKLTRRLSDRGARCVAVEPSAAMRAEFQRVLPETPVAAGTAESIPLARGSVQAVVVAQAFHWFEPDRTLAEIARVLHPGGWLALIWNERDESDPTMAELVRVSKWDRAQPYPVGEDFGAVIDGSGRFRPVERTQFPFVQWVDRAQFVEQVATRSYVAVLPDGPRQALLGQVAELGSRLDEPIAMPYVADLFCARSTPG